MITQEQLRIAERHMARLMKAKRTMERLAYEHGTWTRAIIRALLSGAPIEPGPLTAAPKRHSARRPKWRALYELKLGKDDALRVMSATPPTIWHELVLHRARPRKGVRSAA